MRDLKLGEIEHVYGAGGTGQQATSLQGDGSNSDRRRRRRRRRRGSDSGRRGDNT